MESSSKLFKARKNNGVKVIIEDLKSHPWCPHGPTLLFSREVDNNERQFYACSACRDRKLCNFFLWADEKIKVSKFKLEAWECQRVTFLKRVNHKNLSLALNKIKSLPLHKRNFCQICASFVIEDESKHLGHVILSNITDHQLDHPLGILPPLENAKKEAQYLFSSESVKFLAETFINLNYRNIICIGTPRIHEYVRSNVTNVSSILLDLDDRLHSFFAPLEFCWYNSFNNHFFFDEARDVFCDFLRSTKGENTVLITDPPFGGRIEPLAHTFSSISAQYKKLNNGKSDLPIFWIFPYFMEPQIVNSLPDFQMLDYKVQYDNHPLFQNGPKGRKQGSPVRIFTNVTPSTIKLPENEYKFCRYCDKWVSNENMHCKVCRKCTSKNGETYIHCKICQRCVKPSWQHCRNCQRCAQIDHICGNIAFTGVCLNCKQTGHKKRDCPQVPEETKSSPEKRKNKHKQTKNKKLRA